MPTAIDVIIVVSAHNLSQSDEVRESLASEYKAFVEQEPSLPEDIEEMKEIIKDGPYGMFII